MNAAFHEPTLGGVFRDFIVTEYFLNWWRAEADKLKPKERAHRVTGQPSRHSRVRDPKAVTDALWLTLDNVSAAGRLLGVDRETVLRHRGQGKRSVLYITPAQCHEAVTRHGTWRAARLALGIKTERAFARRMREWERQQQVENSALRTLHSKDEAC